MCDIDRLLAPIGNMDRTELAKAYITALQEIAALRRQIQTAAGQNLAVPAKLMLPTEVEQ